MSSRWSQLGKLLRGVALVGLACQYASPQAGKNQNPASTYPATSPAQVMTTKTYEFSYVEREFTPPARIETGLALSNGFATPEETFAYRAEAMMAGDYDKWLSTWDDDARADFAEEYRAPGKLEAQKNQWQAVFSVGRLVLMKRVETRGFVILTYRVLDSQNKDVGGIELPSVFHQVGSRWLGTQELSQDPLLAESPWMTGKVSDRRDIK